MPVRYLTDGSNDGTIIGKDANDKLAFFGGYPTGQRINAQQAPVAVESVGQCMHFTCNSATTTGPGANTAGNETKTATGLLVNDFVFGINKPTANAGWAICNYHKAVANDTLDYQQFTANGNVNPPDSEQLCVAVFRGMNPVSANLTPAIVNAGVMAEQIFSLDGSGAAATASIDSTGAITTITVSNAGTGYYVPPRVVITPTAPNAANILTGTMSGLPGNMGGGGGSARAVVANGTVTGVIVTDPGSGYTAAPTISFIGGSGIAKGQLVAVEKAAHQANLGIGNVRVVDNGKVGITFFTVGAANVTPTAAETYRFLALNDVPAISPYMTCRANVANCANTSANQTGTITAAVGGVAATDVLIGASTAVTLANVTVTPDVAAAGALSAKYMSGGNTTLAPANGFMNFTVYRPTMDPVMRVFSANLSAGANSIPAANTAEVVYTLPSNVTLQASTVAVVNKPTFTANLTVVGCRVASASTLGITFYNNSAAAITPPTENYLIGNFPTLVTTLHANLVEGHCIKPCSTTINRALDLQNEIRATLVALGILRGS